MLNSPEAKAPIAGLVIAVDNNRVAILCTEAGDIYWTDTTNVEVVRHD